MLINKSYCGLVLILTILNVWSCACKSKGSVYKLMHVLFNANLNYCTVQQKWSSFFFKDSLLLKIKNSYSAWREWNSHHETKMYMFIYPWFVHNLCVHVITAKIMFLFLPKRKWLFLCYKFQIHFILCNSHFSWNRGAITEDVKLKVNTEDIQSN